jgi:glycosyltransferase involved in cell wall biosynthesis
MLLNNSKQRKMFEENAYHHALDNFTWQYIANKYIEEYIRCLDASHIN